jgi:pimeloyl-ACP methyl ester carboxylesterase
MSNATVVLVHGAWHGPWCWERVTPLLDRQGVPWATVDRRAGDPPVVSSDPHFDDLVTRVVIGQIDGPVVLVGHSQGGAAITFAGVGNSQVRHLVYLAAIMPGVEPWLAPTQELIDGIVVAEGGRAFDPAAADVFYGDCTPADVDWVLGQLHLQGTLPEGTLPSPAFAWQEKPSTYVVCTEDRALPPDGQRGCAAHASEVVEWPTSHSPFISRPELVADLLVDLAGRYAE